MRAADTSSSLVGIGPSLWRATAPPPPPTGRLLQAEDCEIAIVGGGLEGLALARALASRGVATAVVEANGLAAAATGASAGVVAPQLVRHSPAGVRRLLGSDAGDRFLRLLGRAGVETFSIIGDRVEEAGACNHGFLAPAMGDSGAGRVAELVQQWSEVRDDLRSIDAAEVTALTGTYGYRAAVLDPTGGSVNPIAYARLLARDALAAGARIFTDSRATALAREGGGWSLKTAGGSLRARRVVLCANGGNAMLHPRLRRTVLPLMVCQVATKPLPPMLRENILPQRHSMTDMEAEVFSIRFDPEGRLITAQPMSRELNDPARLAAVINTRLSTMLPDFPATRLDYAWVGEAWINGNLLPRAVTVDDGLVALQACNGRGIALAAPISRTIADWLVDGTPPAIPVGAPRAIPAYLAARYLPGLLMKTALATRRLRAIIAP